MSKMGCVNYAVTYTVCMEHLVDIKFGDLGANTGWLTFSLANQLSKLNIQLTTSTLVARLAVI